MRDATDLERVVTDALADPDHKDAGPILVSWLRSVGVTRPTDLHLSGLIEAGRLGIRPCCVRTTDRGHARTLLEGLRWRSKQRPWSAYLCVEIRIPAPIRWVSTPPGWERHGTRLLWVPSRS